MSARSAPPPWPPRDSAHLLVSGSQMAELENQLFASGLPVEALMEKAALALSRRLLEQHGQTLQQRGGLVLVGPGHNGGDGLVIARELHLAGIAVAIWSPFERHKPLTASHLRHCRWLGIAQRQQPPDPADAALWIDALLGIGQRRAPGEAIERLLGERQRQRPGGLVAVDVPTGLCADSGRRLGDHSAVATTTYTIGLIKTGLLQDPALAAVGRLERIELGLPGALLAALPAEQPLALGAADLAGRPRPLLDPAAAKYGRGRLLVVAGSTAYPGAACLTLAGASSSGAGSLRAALPAPLAGDLWLHHPHVVVQQQLACRAEGSLQLQPLQGLEASRLDAVLVGPGLGPAPAGPGDAGAGLLAPEEEQAWRQLQGWAGLLVLDADGLNRLAGPVATSQGGSACAWLQQRSGPTWITPHAGEFARLFPALSQLPPLEAAGEAAGQSGACVLLKGARSVVAAADGRRWQLMEASPACARAGLGDVLAGHAAGMGAMALAGSGQADASWLAAAALNHAQAGLQCSRLEQAGGPGGDTSPAAVARQLARLCCFASES